MSHNPNPQKKYPSPATIGIIIGLSIILGVCLIPTIINLAINQTLFKTDFYAKVLNKTNFYEQIPVLLADTVMTSGTAALQGGLLAGLDENQFNWLMTSMLPPGWIEAEADVAMLSVLDFMNFKTTTLSIVIDFKPIKDHLSSQQGKQSLITLLDNLPDCTNDQLTQIMIAMQSGQGGFALCHPPSSDLFNMDTMLDPVINSFSASLPSAIILPPEGQANIFNAIVKSPVFQIYRIVRSVLSIFPWVCMVLALMIFLLSVRSLHWLAGALGVPLVFASMTSSIPGAWLFLSGARDFSGWFPTPETGTLQGLEALLVEVFQQGLQTAGQGLLIWCLGGLTIGLVLLVVWIVAKR
jgi:hypothetical protein